MSIKHKILLYTCILIGMEIKLVAMVILCLIWRDQLVTTPTHCALYFTPDWTVDYDALFPVILASPLSPHLSTSQ